MKKLQVIHDHFETLVPESYGKHDSKGWHRVKRNAEKNGQKMYMAYITWLNIVMKNDETYSHCAL